MAFIVKKDKVSLQNWTRCSICCNSPVLNRRLPFERTAPIPWSLLKSVLRWSCLECYSLWFFQVDHPFCKLDVKILAAKLLVLSTIFIINFMSVSTKAIIVLAIGKVYSHGIIEVHSPPLLNIYPSPKFRFPLIPKLQDPS